MEHHLARDLLEGYVENSLEPETRSQLEAHLATCETCRSILDANEAPVALPSLAKPENDWDEKRMRKTVRRTLFRLVFDALSIWIIGFIVLTIVSSFALQPLLINRGDRSRTSAIATWDLAIMTTPGRDHRSLAKRCNTLSVERTVSTSVSTPAATSGPSAPTRPIWACGRFRNATGGDIQPFLEADSQGVPARPDPRRHRRNRRTVLVGEPHHRGTSCSHPTPLR